MKILKFWIRFTLCASLCAWSLTCAQSPSDKPTPFEISLQQFNKSSDELTDAYGPPSNTYIDNINISVTWRYWADNSGNIVTMFLFKHNKVKVVTSRMRCSNEESVVSTKALFHKVLLKAGFTLDSNGYYTNKKYRSFIRVGRNELAGYEAEIVTEEI